MFETVFIKDENKKTLVIERQFAASKDRVWQAFTDNKMLEQWWAPQPFTAVTKTFSFTEGGKWHYYMKGPEGEMHWALMEFETIKPEEYFTAIDSFADETGNRNTTMPVTPFKTEFMEKDGNTRIRSTSTFATLEDMNKLIEMGMAEGMAMAHRQLDAILAK